MPSLVPVGLPSWQYRWYEATLPVVATPKFPAVVVGLDWEIVSIGMGGMEVA